MERLVDRVLDRLRVGQRQARVLGEGEQHLALGLRVACGPAGGWRRRGCRRPRRARAPGPPSRRGRRRRRTRAAPGRARRSPRPRSAGPRRSPGRRAPSPIGLRAVRCARSSGLTPARGDHHQLGRVLGVDQAQADDLVAEQLGGAVDDRRRRPRRGRVRLTIELWILESRSSSRWRSGSDVDAGARSRRSGARSARAGRARPRAARCSPHGQRQHPRHPAEQVALLGGEARGRRGGRATRASRRSSPIGVASAAQSPTPGTLERLALAARDRGEIAPRGASASPKPVEASDRSAPSDRRDLGLEGLGGALDGVADRRRARRRPTRPRRRTR